MRMPGYFQQLRFYDPGIDGEAIRISGFDGKGGEFFMTLELAAAGAARRKQRRDVEDAISEAIDAGLEPGEVRIDG